jgi:hypothetical protein
MPGKRTTLKIDEIKHLGLPTKKHKQYRLGKDKLKALYLYRGFDEAIVDECIAKGISPDKVVNYWYKGKHFSIHTKNDNSNEELEQFKNDLINSLVDHSPKYPKVKRTVLKDGHCLVIDPADVHIGKLCSALETEEYNSNIAVQRVKEGVQGILNKSKGFNIDKIVFIAGNDILHIDNPHRKTTSGTPQDTDGMWYENFLDAKKLYVEVIEMLLSIADVHFVYNPSNHDYMTGFMLADVIKTHFRRSKNITFDTSIKHRKYYLYGTNLIGSTHGDGARNNDLPLLMAGECPELWSKSIYRYIYTHHVHHKTSKDYQANVTLESLRSPSGSDSWHDRNGYTSKKAIEGFIHSKDSGQVARITHYF